MNLEELAQKRRKPKSENLAVEVISYDRTNPSAVSVQGKRLDTGEVATFYLTPPPPPNKDGYKRPEISDFAGKLGSSKYATEVGGVIRFDQAVNKGDGIYEAYWPVIMQPRKGQGAVLVGDIRVLPAIRTSNGLSQSVEVLYPGEAVVTTNSQGLLAKVKENFGYESPGEASSYLRVFGHDAAGKERVDVIKVYQTFSKVGENMVRDTADVATEKFLARPGIKDLLAAFDADNGQSRIEVIPVETIPFGKDTVGKKAGTNQSFERQFESQEYRAGRRDDEDFRLPVNKAYGFGSGSVAIEISNATGRYIATEAKLVELRVVTPDKLQTPNFGPDAHPVLTDGQDEVLELDAGDAEAPVQAVQRPVQPVPAVARVGDDVEALDQDVQAGAFPVQSRRTMRR